MTFPPASWLGSSLNLLNITPIDFKEVEKAVLSIASFVDLDTKTRTVKVGDKNWDVPNNVSIAADDVTAGQTSHHTWESGQAAVKNMSADTSLSGKYMAFKCDGDVQYALNKTFTSDNSYDLYSFVQTHAIVKLNHLAKSLDEGEILKTMNDYKPWNKDDKATRDSYRSFYELYGSHVIIGCDYGAKFCMTNYASNSSKKVSENFQAIVNAEYSGVIAEGQFDAKFSTGEERTEFEKSWSKIVTICGGDATIATQLSSAPQAKNTSEVLHKWIQTANTNPMVMSFELLPIWSMFQLSHKKEIRDRVQDFENAYGFLSNNPRKHRTDCTFSLQSDWAEVMIRTPSARIVSVTPPSDLPKDAYTWTERKIVCGKEHSYDFKHGCVFSFVLENDGSPVSMELSHGYDGAEAGKGNCQVTLGNKPAYENNETTSDKNWNTKVFINCEVNPNPVADA